MAPLGEGFGAGGLSPLEECGRGKPAQRQKGTALRAERLHPRVVAPSAFGLRRSRTCLAHANTAFPSPAACCLTSGSRAEARPAYLRKAGDECPPRSRPMFSA